MNTTLMEPFSLDLDFLSGRLSTLTSRVVRHLSDMPGMYADREAEEQLLAQSNPLIYEVEQYDVPTDAGQLIVCTTILYPGCVGDEFFMTKGHFHELRDRAEVYLGLQGQGMLLLESEDHERHIVMQPGVVAYVPPYYAHRSVNTGGQPFIFFAVYPADAGHDYGTIETAGFAQRVVDRVGAPTVVASRSVGADLVAPSADQTQ